jgi:hypothetical protein
MQPAQSYQFTLLSVSLYSAGMDTTISVSIQDWKINLEYTGQRNTIETRLWLRQELMNLEEICFWIPTYFLMMEPPLIVVVPSHALLLTLPIV